MGQAAYSTRQVAEILGLSPRQVRRYARSDLLRPERGPGNAYRFTFQDIVLLRTARELRSGGVPARRVNRALESLRKQLPTGRPLSALRISTQGDRVVVRDREALWEPDTGQVHFDFSVAELAKRVAPLARATADERAVRESGAGAELDADQWYDLAVDLEAVAPAKAREAYRRAIALYPGHPEAHLNLGRLLHEEGQLADAESHYRQALAADPENAMAAYNLGVVLEDRDRPQEAVQAYKRALAHDPGHAEAHFNVGRLYESAGQEELAVRHLAAYRRLKGIEGSGP